MENQLIKKVDEFIVCNYFEKLLPNNSGNYCNHQCLYCSVNQRQLNRLYELEVENKKYKTKKKLKWQK